MESIASWPLTRLKKKYVFTRRNGFCNIILKSYHDLCHSDSSEIKLQLYGIIHFHQAKAVLSLSIALRIKGTSIKLITE